MSYEPKLPGTLFQSFWSTGNGWGLIVFQKKIMKLEVTHGNLELTQFSFPGIENTSNVMLNNRPVQFSIAKSGYLVFENPVKLSEANKLIIKY